MTRLNRIFVGQYFCSYFKDTRVCGDVMFIAKFFIYKSITQNLTTYIYIYIYIHTYTYTYIYDEKFVSSFISENF